MLRSVLAASALLFAFAQPALACRGADYTVGIVYDAPPARVGADAVILDVVFPESEVSAPRSDRIVTANVRRVVQGEFEGETVRVRVRGHSCSAPFRFGREGLIVGRIDQTADGQVFLPRGETMSIRRRRLASEAVSHSAVSP